MEGRQGGKKGGKGRGRSETRRGEGEGVTKVYWEDKGGGEGERWTVRGVKVETREGSGGEGGVGW